MSNYGVDNTGFTPARTDDVRENMRAHIEGELGQPVDASPNSVIGMLLGVIAYAIAWVWSGLQGLWDALSPSTARGAALDDQAETVGVFRHPAAKAHTRAIVIIGDAFAVIPPGLVARGLYRGVEYSFELLEPVTLDGTGRGENGNFRALTAGFVTLPPGVVTDITAGVSGADRVEQPGIISGGRDVETDDELRVRRDTAFLGIGGGNDFAVAARVAALPFVIQSTLRGNRQRVPVDGMPPNSFSVIVWPDGITEDEENELAITIARAQGQGAEPNGNVKRFVEDSQGVMQPVAWSYATPIRYYVKVTLSTGNNFAGEDAVKAAVLSVVGEVNKIGGTIYASSFLCPVLAVLGVLGGTVQVSTNGTTWANSIPVAWNAVGTLDGADVQVVV